MDSPPTAQRAALHLHATGLVHESRPARPAWPVRITLEPGEAFVQPGQRVRMVLRVENRTSRAQDVVLGVGAPGPGWVVALHLRSIYLAPLSSARLVLRIDAPADAQPGERVTFQVQAAGSGRLSRLAKVDAEVTVC